MNNRCSSALRFCTSYCVAVKVALSTFICLMLINNIAGNSDHVNQVLSHSSRMTTF